LCLCVDCRLGAVLFVNLILKNIFQSLVKSPPCASLVAFKINCAVTGAS